MRSIQILCPFLIRLCLYYWVVKVLDIFCRPVPYYRYALHIFSPIMWGLSFHFDKCSLTHRSFKFWWNPIYLFVYLFLACAFGVIAKNPLFSSASWRFYLCLFLSFIVCLTFRTLIHFNFLCSVCGMEVFHFELFHIFWEFTAFKKVWKPQKDL